jgi:2-keto-3-deoxy-L-rhamnonate aldolase RhmA
MVGLHGNLGSFSNLHRDKNMTRPKIGIWSVIRDSLVIEAIAAQLDFIILDLEHGFRDFGQFQANFRSAQRYSNEVYVRIRRYDDPWLQALLDIGVTNFVVPQIRTVHEFQNFVNATSFPPNGKRGTHPRFEAYLARNTAALNAGNIKRCLIIETKEAVEQITALCKLEEVDEIYIGTYDLCSEFGIDQFTKTESLVLLLESICKVAEEYRKPIISMLGNVQLEQFYASINVQGRVIGIDEMILTGEVGNVVKRLMAEFGN